MKTILSLFFTLLTCNVLSQTYTLWLVDSDNNKHLIKTDQTYQIKFHSDTTKIHNDALSISFTKTSEHCVVEFGDDVFMYPFKTYSEYPRWLVVVFEPPKMEPTRYWFHLNVNTTLQY